MMTISVTLMDSSPIFEQDRARAEDAYEAAIVKLVPSMEILERIQMDDQEGVEEGSPHFETCSSAWSMIDSLGNVSVREVLGYWPGETAHFETRFF